MAVSKIAVMALVGILAIPILLGYAFNLSEVSVTEYKPEGESVNVTPILQNGTAYSYAHGDTAQMNINAGTPKDAIQDPIIYQSKGTNKTSLYALQQNGTATAPPSFEFAGFYYIIISVTGYTNGNYLNATITKSDNTIIQADNIISIYYDDKTKTLDYYLQPLLPSTLGPQHYSISNPKSITFGAGSFLGTWYGTWYYKTTGNQSQWVDLSKGFYFAAAKDHKISVPQDTIKLLLTINLDSITDANYSIGIYPGPAESVGFPLRLQKVTEDGIVKWSVCDNTRPSTTTQQLYYDPTRANNTYQMEISITKTGTVTYPGFDYTYNVYKASFQLDYVGGWPPLFGKANSYQTYNIEITKDYLTSLGEISFDEVVLKNLINSTRTPLIRVDDAYYRAFSFPTIEDKTYTAADFKSNPVTTITNINKYGTSLTFAGNTYEVDGSGNITMGTHKIPINGMRLESVPVTVGYENRINGTVISVSADPSTITFNGQWGASISTTAQAAATYNKTQWTAGSFGWDGIDTNFLIVGLVSCLGVFVGLGIYARRTGQAVLPLFIVCGCAAAVFICML